MDCLIISGGSFDIKDIERYNLDNYFKIAVDSGLEQFYRLKINPDLIVGDMDSVNKKIYSVYNDYNIEKLLFKPEKDSTDTEIAINYVIEKKFKKVLLFGAIGSRIDHSIGNINLLKKLKDSNIEGAIIDSNNKIMVIGKGKTVITKGDYEYISLVTFGHELKGVSLDGFKYGLNNKDFKDNENTGISNELIEKYGKISIKEGYCLLVKSKD